MGSLRPHPVWEASLPSFSPLKKDLQADVCIVGAGIAGITSAYLLALEGRAVVLIDAGPLAAGETARTTAHLSNESDDGYEWLEKIHGEEGARLFAQSHTAAIDKIEEIAAKERIDCEFIRLDGYLFAASGVSGETLDRELKAAKRAGLADVEMVDKAPIDFDTGRALRFTRQGQIHPLKYMRGLIQRLKDMDVRIFSGTHVRRVKGGRMARVVTDDGFTVSAKSVIVATNTPFNDVVVIHTKQAAYRTHVLGARVPRGSVPLALYWDEPPKNDPYHYVRLTSPVDKAYDILIVGGEDYRSGQANDHEERQKRLEGWARERFPMIESVDFHWSGQIIEPVDGVAFIGRNPMDSPNVYIATADSGQGMTHGTIAGLLLTDLILERKNVWEKFYDPSRKPLHVGWDYAKENTNTVAQYADWLTGGEVDSVDRIRPGEGAVIRHGLKKVAVYKDEAGIVHSCSAVCTHLNGIVSWNSFEMSWDCPAHGSRFDPQGKVIHGPAAENLEPAALHETREEGDRHVKEKTEKSRARGGLAAFERRLGLRGRRRKGLPRRVPLPRGQHGQERPRPR